MEVIISPNESINCKMIDAEKSIWSCTVKDANDQEVSDKKIGEVNEWVVGEGVTAEVAHKKTNSFDEYNLRGNGTEIKCWIDENNGIKKAIIECKNY